MRRQPLRISGFEYGRGMYFVTACANEHRSLFGSVVDDRVHLTVAGRILQVQLEAVSTRMPGVTVDTFVVMPNHMHIVVGMDDPVLGVETARARQASPLRLRLGTVVAAVKSGSAREIRVVTGRVDPVWQRGYYDHVIRDEEDLRRIREYIATNPMRWALDHENLS